MNARPKRKKFWRIALWIIFGFLLILGIVVYWIWVNRLSLIEDQIVSEMESRGYSVELTLEELYETRAMARDVRVSKDGKSVLHADQVEVDYVWRDAMEGRFKKVTITGPEVTVQIDETGRPKDPFASGGSGGSSPDMPSGGISIRDGRLNVQSPFGNLYAAVDAEFLSAEQFSAKLLLDPSRISYGDLSGVISGDVDLKTDGQARKASLDFKIPEWTYKNMSGRDLSVIGTVDLLVSDDKVIISGPLEASLAAFLGKAVSARDIKLHWRGKTGLTRGPETTLLAEGDWKADVRAFGVTDSRIRSDLADTLTLYSSMARTPVTQDFAKPFQLSVSELLRSASISGAGGINKTPDMTMIGLSEPLLWASNTHRAALKPGKEGRDYFFDRKQQLLTVNLEAALSGPYPVNIKNGELVFRSTNGRNIKGTDSFRGQVSLPGSWKSQTKDGRPAEIRPLDARIHYRNENPARRRLSLSGQLDYDGDIPGGYAENLKADGRLDVDIGQRTDIYFTPRENARISMDAFYNPTEWTASNISFALDPHEHTPLFSLADTKGTLRSIVRDVRTDLANMDGSRTLSLAFAQANIDAEIAEPQSWTINGQGVTMTSDNTPSEGTVMTTGQAMITALVGNEGLPEFTINTRSADIKTNAVDAKGLAVQVAGTPEKFRVDYQNGMVGFLATEFPDFEMTGFVNFLDDKWVGTAETVLPYDGKTPAIVDYQFINSRGFAVVDIPELSFSPSGLQPQSFIPALQGKIADVEGLASARINLEFSDQDGVKSSGQAKLIEMDMGTAPGPVRGLNGELNFASFFPLVTEGTQKVTISAWDVGFPLPEGEIEFEAIPDGIRIESARWPVGTGAISLDPAIWLYTAAENRMTLRVDNVSISEFLGDLGGKNFEATGDVSGILPVVISGVDVQVEKGRLAVENGGVVRFSTPFTDKAGEVNGYAQLAFNALKEFYYEELEVILDGPLDGLINVKIVFEGFNPNVMDGAYIRYNVNIEGELLNIIRNFQNLGAKITEEVKNVVLRDRNE